jgi:hypothetical protein
MLCALRYITPRGRLARNIHGPGASDTKRVGSMRGVIWV